MDRNEVKKELEYFAYDFEYYVEKSKECEKFKEESQHAINRIKRLNEHYKNDNAAPQTAIDDIIEQVMGEEEALIRLLRKKHRIESAIERLSQPDRTLLYLRYLRFFTFEQIATKMHYSTKRIYQLHTLAVEHYVNAYIMLGDMIELDAPTSLDATTPKDLFKPLDM